MKFAETPVRGVWIIDLELRQDERGFFARSFCRREFAERGIDFDIVQCNVSHSGRRGTLRGMHWQRRPHEEAKIVRVVRGAVWDVALDLRADSPTYKRHVGVELTAESRRMIHVPQGCAHGFLTLADDTEVEYLMSEYFVADAARGLRWDDPAFGLAWPEAVRVISARDRSYPDYEGGG